MSLTHTWKQIAQRLTLASQSHRAGGERTTVVAFEGLATFFKIENPAEHIQGFHLRGSFYEIRQLLAHRDLIPMDSTVVDVGANVGNHTLFYAQHTQAARVYSFEPNPRAGALLEQNVAVNQSMKAFVDLSHAGLAIGRERGLMRVENEPVDNLGGTTLVATTNPHGAIRVSSLDCPSSDYLRQTAA